MTGMARRLRWRAGGLWATAALSLVSVIGPGVADAQHPMPCEHPVLTLDEASTLLRVEAEELRYRVRKVERVIAMLFGLGDRFAPGRIKAAHQMPPVERVLGAVCLERLLASVELVSNLRVFSSSHSELF